MIHALIAAYHALATLADDLDTRITLEILAFAPSSSIDAIAARRDSADRAARAKLHEIADEIFALDYFAQRALIAPLGLAARAIVEARLEELNAQPAPEAPALAGPWDPWTFAGLPAPA